MLQVTPLPAFADNYIWVIEFPSGECAVVDPGDAGPVESFLEASGRPLSHILLTHHHLDHIGGVETMLQTHRPVVYGPDDTRMPGATRVVREGDEVMVNGLRLTVMEVPGHTSTHIAFYGDDNLFCGDTLFSVGCGRLFEGTPEQMLRSLDKLVALPPRTRVYCTHEYTESNCRFALEVEPGNQALVERAGEVSELRAEGRITLPSTIGNELETNPFLRSREPEVIAAAQRRGAGGSGPTDVFAAIRQWKDSA